MTKVEVSAYAIRRPKVLFFCEAAELHYDCKLADRSGIEAIRRSVAQALASGQIAAVDGDWDIILCRDGLVLEASYAALLCPDGERWLTPQRPLLASTRLAAYAMDGVVGIEPASLTVAQVKAIGRVVLVNAMLDLEDRVEVTDLRDFCTKA